MESWWHLILSPFLLVTIIVTTTGQPTAISQPLPAVDHLLNHLCSNDKGNYTTSDSYHTNLNQLLSSLPFTKSNGFGFYNSSYGGSTSSSEAIYAIGLCRGDIRSTSDCLQCLSVSGSVLMELCPNQKEAIIWYGHCMLRYSNSFIYGVLKTQPSLEMWSIESVPPSQFDMFFRKLTMLLKTLRTDAATGGSLKFAEDKVDIICHDGRTRSLTALVQCSPDLSELDCTTCLIGASEQLPKCCHGKGGGRVLRPSCNLNYHVTMDAVPTPGPNIAWPGDSSQAPSPSPDQNPARHGSMIGIIIVVVATAVSLVVTSIVGIYMKVAKRRPQSELLETRDEHLMEYLQFDYGDIQVATNNFSEANKLGDDGYGTVYRGSLPNDKSIAVKRLSIKYAKDHKEITEEVLLMAPKLQHPNLVRLLGFASNENSERLLVYELFPNAALGYIIFDRIRSTQWDWEMRYNIIISIARGLIHLHDNHFVHGDVNASNILVDARMNPKISNSGMARFFAVDHQTQGDINGIHLLNLMSNTYMAPEAINGQSSPKSDVYSFGVLVVEIVIGQEIGSLPSEKLNEKDLLSLAWRNWAEGTIRNLIDPTLWTGSGTELMKSCIRIGLLCMQRTRTDRPTMSSVIQMLTRHSSAIPQLSNTFSSFGIIGAMNDVEAISDPSSRRKAKSFISKMRSATTGIINQMRR